MAKKTVVDLSSIFHSAADSGLDTSVLDAGINLPQAANVIEWATNPEFRSRQGTLYGRQAEMCVRLFADYCPACTDLDYLAEVPVSDTIDAFKSRVQLLEHGMCPKCVRSRQIVFQDWWDAEGKHEYPLFADDPYTIPTEVIGCIGQRSGKSTVAGGIIATYRTHQHLFIKNPYSYYRVDSATPFQISFVSTTVPQVVESLWPYFLNTVKNSPWFQRYANEMKSLEKKQGLKPEALFKIRDLSVSFTAKSLLVKAEAAGEALRGRTRIMVVIDELAFFGAKKAVVSGDRVYTALNNSLSTVRNAAARKFREGEYNVPTAIMANISSPASKHDKIMSLLREAKKSPMMMGFHYASWEFNPEMSRESLRAEEIKDEAEFWRNYGAVPPLAAEPFIGNLDRVKATQDEKHSPLFELGTHYVSIGKDELVGAAHVKGTDERTISRIIACDAGHTKNAFSICMYHVEKHEGEYMLFLDAAYAAIPEQRGKTFVKVSFPSMADTILDLAKRYRVRHVLYDRWQSIGEIQRLRREGIDAEAYSPKFTDFEATRDFILTGQFHMPTWEKPLDMLEADDVIDLRRHPYTHFGYQMATVRETGKKLMKPEKGDDDMFRTLVLAHAKFRKNYDDYVSVGIMGDHQQGRDRRPVVGAMATFSGQKRSLGVSNGGSHGPSSPILGRGKGRSGR